MSHPNFFKTDTISYDLPTKLNLLSGIYTNAVNRVAKSVAFTVWAGDTDTVKEHYYACDGTFAATLVAATDADAADGRLVYIKNIGAGTITVTPDGSDTVEGAATLALAPNDSATLCSDGVSNWEII